MEDYEQETFVLNPNTAQLGKEYCAADSEKPPSKSKPIFAPTWTHEDSHGPTRASFTLVFSKSGPKGTEMVPKISRYQIKYQISSPPETDRIFNVNRKFRISESFRKAS